MLADHFLCLWKQSITGCGSEYAQRVLPDGCIDIIFVNDQAPTVVGPWTKPFIARFPVGTEIIGARWHPGRAPALLGLPAADTLVAGRDGWQFLKLQDDILDRYRGIKPLSLAELDAWIDSMERRQREVETQGSVFMVFIAPEAEFSLFQPTYEAMLKSAQF